MLLYDIYIIYDNYKYGIYEEVRADNIGKYYLCSSLLIDR